MFSRIVRGEKPFNQQFIERFRWLPGYAKSSTTGKKRAIALVEITHSAPADSQSCLLCLGGSPAFMLGKRAQAPRERVERRSCGLALLWRDPKASART